MFRKHVLCIQTRLQPRNDVTRYIGSVRAALKSSAQPHSSLHVHSASSPLLTTVGNPLSSAETKSLECFYKCHSDSMDEELWGPLLAQKGVRTLHDLQDTAILEGAMLALEQVYLSQHSPDATQDTISYLLGTWRMTFATGGFPRHQVVPVPEFFEVLPEGGKIEVKTLLGPLTPVFHGAYLWDPEQRLLRYGFNKASLSVANSFTVHFPFSFTDRQAKFFFIGEHHACARSGKDGMILFAREDVDN